MTTNTAGNAGQGGTGGGTASGGKGGAAAGSSGKGGSAGNATAGSAGNGGSAGSGGAAGAGAAGSSAAGAGEAGAGEAGAGGATQPSDSLEVTVSGVPNGETAAVSVTGPDNFSQNISATTTLGTLAAGSYTISAPSINVHGAQVDSVFDAVVSG
ncbi:MAG TPA: hypothetical protein VGM29_19015, partial [Polyangiaceae bacterium]